MNRNIPNLLLALTLCGCASGTKIPADTVPNRYASIDRQRTYVSLCFDLDTSSLLGLNRKEVEAELGKPFRIQKPDDSQDREIWIYYPDNTNNFIAIFVSFSEDKVSDCSYQSVM